MKKQVSTLFLAALVQIATAQHDSLRLEKMPIFAGCFAAADQRKCSDETLLRFIADNLRYPAEAAERKLEGTVVVSFVVDEKGQVGQEAVLRDLGSSCGEAALSVVRKMPRWHPAERAGQAVKTKLTLPIRFSLKSQAADEAKNFSINWGTLRGDRCSKSQLTAALADQLYVRDAYGEARQIAELVFIFEKKRKSRTAKISGATLDSKMKSLVKKASSGGTFTVSASVQQDGKFVVVEKSFQVE